MAGRIRGAKLQTIRKRWFAKNPLCVACKRKGYITVATELDHITPLYKGGKDDDTNRQGLCADCHKAKTNVDLGYKPKGCDAEGNPINGWAA